MLFGIQYLATQYLEFKYENHVEEIIKTPTK